MIRSENNDTHIQGGGYEVLEDFSNIATSLLEVMIIDGGVEPTKAKMFLASIIDHINTDELIEPIDD